MVKPLEEIILADINLSNVYFRKLIKRLKLFVDFPIENLSQKDITDFSELEQGQLLLVWRMYEMDLLTDVQFCPHCASHNVNIGGVTGTTLVGGIEVEMDADWAYCNDCEKNIEDY